VYVPSQDQKDSEGSGSWYWFPVHGSWLAFHRVLSGLPVGSSLEPAGFHLG
jgi:hypothetical protein